MTSRIRCLSRFRTAHLNLSLFVAVIIAATSVFAPAVHAERFDGEWEFEIYEDGRSSVRQNVVIKNGAGSFEIRERSVPFAINDAGEVSVKVNKTMGYQFFELEMSGAGKPGWISGKGFLRHSQVSEPRLSSFSFVMRNQRSLAKRADETEPSPTDKDEKAQAAVTSAQGADQIPAAERPANQTEQARPEPAALQPRTVVQANKPAPPDRQAPRLVLPANLRTDGPIVELTGSATDASQIVEIAVNGTSVAFAADGSFSMRRGVPRGNSVLEVVAMDEWGNVARQSVTVRRDAPPPNETLATLPPREAFGLEQAGRFHALVIGNDRYKDMPDLETAVEDARAVADLLSRSYGFDVKLLTDARRADITREISRLRRQLTARDNLLIYYAGHGYLDEEVDEGFWLPVDAERTSDTAWLSNDYLTRNLRGMSANHVLIVADSCYSGTLVRNVDISLRSGTDRSEWYQRMASKRARTALTSGGLEPVLDGGGGGHSVFAKAFLDALSGNPDVMDAHTLFERIKRPVALNSEQTPVYADVRRAGHDGGDFLFIRK